MVCLLVCRLTCSGQNLVPNGDFEGYDVCPVTFSGIGGALTYNTFHTVRDWVRPTDGSSDYFNACNPFPGDASVPRNAMGYQQPHSGNGYAGLIAVFDTTYAEYIACKLLSPLIAGKHYKLGFYTNATPGRSGLGIVSEIGAHVSVALPYSASSGTLYLPYTVRSTPGQFFTDTAAWYHVSGFFTASGGEEWITIGCFNDIPAIINLANPAAGGMYAAYQYVDDVSLVGAVELAYTHDTTVCDTTRRIRFLSSVDNAESYRWNTGDTLSSMETGHTGTYWCVAFKADTFTTDTFHLRYTPLAKPALHDTAICINSSSPVWPAQGLIWYHTQEDTLAMSAPPVIDTRVEDTLTFFVAAREGTCQSEKVRLSIYVVQPPMASLGKDIAMCRDQGDTTICVQDLKPTTTYRWSTGAQAPCIQASAGIYFLEAVNACGLARDTIEVKDYPCSSCMFIPTAFTPNGDGHNDIFRPVISCPVTKYTLRIYDRWGQMVFISSTVGEGWNGVLNGKAADVGTYMYLITGENALTGSHYKEKGDLLLIR